MVDYEEIVQKIINSITIFSFEFDFELMKKEMELQEISIDEIEKLGENKVSENFNKGIFKIKMPNGNLIDINSIKEHSAENNIKEPVLYINPNFKYVQWILNKDFINPQLKRHIKNQLKNNTDLNLDDVKKVLLREELKNKKIEGYINGLPIITSNLISEGKFQIQSSCSKESAIQMVNDAINEISTEKIIFISSKIKRDYNYIIIYIIFIILVVVLWFLNKQDKKLQYWFLSTIGLILFLIPLVVMRLINHSFFETLFFKKKSEKKYEKEFNNKLIN